MESARPPRPRLAIGNPSKVVVMDCGVPGVLIRIAENEPPYVEPIYTVPRKIRPVVGSIENEIGNITAQEKVELRPGSAPSRIPITSPPTATAMTMGVNALPIWLKSSISQQAD